MTDHLKWDRLNDYVDGLLTSEDRAVVAAHLLMCAECRSQLDGLRQTLVSANDAEREAELPPELWTSIERSIATTRSRSAPPGWWHSPRKLAAAAVILVAVTSGLTSLVLRDADSEVSSPTIAVSDSPGVVLPVGWLTTERQYQSSVDELRELLDERRSTLSRKTIAIVERNLATIDSAIAETRDALLKDPANADLTDALSASYRQKVELLRRATQLDDQRAT